MSEDFGLEPHVVKYLASLGTTPEHLAQHYPHTYAVFATLGPDEIKTLDARIADLESDLAKILAWIPNVPHPSVPKADDACICSAMCSDIRGASTCASSKLRICRPRCANTSAPSRTWAGSPRPVCTTT